mgnify:CR=1 FL=1
MDSFYAADISSPIELQVKWLDKPELQVEKNADKSGKTYKLGDIITYTLDVTQQIEKAIAKKCGDHGYDSYRRSKTFRKIQ